MNTVLIAAAATTIDELITDLIVEPASRARLVDPRGSKAHVCPAAW
jgi:hypothetical protein